MLKGSAAVGVPHAETLLALADAALGVGDGLSAARARVASALGDAALVDAAAVIAGFDGITRIADATGIPLEPVKADATADFRGTLGLDGWIAAKW